MRSFLDAFEDANGSGDDARWGARAQLRLAMAGTSESEVERLMADALEQVVTSHEPAEELFGPADAWARGQVAALAADQVRFEQAPDGGVALTLAVSLGTCVLVPVVFGIDSAFRYGSSMEWHLGHVLAPFVLAGLLAVFVEVWERVGERRGSYAWFLVLPVAVAVVTAVFVVGHRVGLGRHSTWWWVAEAALVALCSVALGLLSPSGGAAVAEGQLDDDAWLAQAHRNLALRGDQLPGQVEGRLAEARAFVEEAGTSLDEEFGSPLTWAHGVPVDTQRASLLSALVWTVLAAATMVIAAGGGYRSAVGGVLLTVAMVVFAARRWVRWWQARRRWLRARSTATGRA